MEPKANGKAIAALVIGIISLVIPYIGFILGVIGIVLASKALKEIKTEYQTGKGMAIAGLVCSIVATGIYALIIFIALVIGAGALFL